MRRSKGYSRLSMILIITMLISLSPFQYVSGTQIDPDNVFLDDDASDLTGTGWTVYPDPLPGLYVTDASNSKGNPNDVQLKSVEEGQYLFYADHEGVGNAITMTKNLPVIGPGPWTLQLTVRFADLLTPSANHLYRGIVFKITANEKFYFITFNDQNKVLFRKAQGNYVQNTLPMPSDTDFHTWEIAFDGEDTTSLLLDGVKVAEQTGVGQPTDGADNLTIYNDPGDWQAGTNEVYVDSLRMFRPTVGPIQVNGVTLNTASTTLKVGASRTLIATITPADAVNRNVTWTSSNLAVATVDADGKVVAVSVGEATVTATTDDRQYTSDCIVTVQSRSTGGEHVVFEDDASSLKAAGWELVPELAPGNYITDSSNSMGNPDEVVMKPVEPGQYLLYGDKIGSDNRTYMSMLKSVTIGPGAWVLGFDARIVDLFSAHELNVDRGIVFDIAANGKQYQLTFNDRNKVLFKKDVGGSYYEKELVPEDNGFHHWEIAFDGLSTVTLLLDQIKVAEYEGIGIPTSRADEIAIHNTPNDWKRGANEFYLDHIKLVKTDNSLIDDNAVNLAVAEWNADVPKLGSYITDYAKSNGSVAGMKSAENGRYLVYGDNQAAQPSQMTMPISVGNQTWALEFDARFADLAAPAVSDPSKGLSFEIVAGTKKYKFTLNDKNNLYALKNEQGEYEHIQLNMPDRNYFHRWTIGHDEFDRMFLTLDGAIIGVFTGIGATANEPERISIINDSVNTAGGTTEVYFDNIKLVRNVHPLWYKPAINGVTVLPTSDSESVDMIVNTIDVDPVSLSTQKLTMQSTLYKDNRAIATQSQPLGGSMAAMTMKPGKETGQMKLELKLLEGSYVVHDLTQYIEVRSAVDLLEPGQTASAKSDNIYLFTQLDQLQDNTGKLPAQSGWKQSLYQYDGTEEGGIFLENDNEAGTLEVPVNLKGWFAVYIGYVSGTEALNVSDGVQQQKVTIDGSVFSPANAYGSKAMSEMFAMATNFNDNRLQISPVPGKMARIAYIKFKSLTNEEIAIAQKPDEGSSGKRVIYNNDSQSDMASGWVKDEATLKSNVVDIYQNKDVGSLYYAAGGGTFYLYIDSPYVGKPYDGLTPEQEALMRDVDKVERNVILNYFLNIGKIPLKIVAQRSNEIGIETIASLRMNAFAPEDVFPYFNGSIYPQFKNFKYINYDGSVRDAVLSYGYPEVRERIKILLDEIASYDHVEGVELDFARYPFVMGWEDILSDGYEAEYGINPKRENTLAGLRRWQQYKADIMTQFMREVRQMLPGKQISVRIPYYDYFRNGLDVQTWIHEGLIDVLTVGALYHERFWDNLSEFADMVKDTNVKLYGDINHTLAGDDPSKQEDDLLKRGIKLNMIHSSVSPEQYLQRAHQFYEAGYDGIYIFNNPSGKGTLGLLGDKVKVEKSYTFSYPATWVQNLITAFGTPNNTIFEDDASSLADKEWNVYPAPQEGVYITDSGNSKGNPNNVKMKAVGEGQYLFYADDTGKDAITMTKNITIGPGPWTLQLTARFADLITPSANNLYRGITFKITANQKLYFITFNDKNKVLFRKAQGNYDQHTLPMPEDQDFHKWEITFDGQDTVSIWLDDVKVAEQAGVGLPIDAADSLTIYNDPLDRQSGSNEVYVDHIRMIRNDFANANLSAIIVKGVNVDQFLPNKLAYTVRVPNNTTSVTVEGTKYDARANVQITGGSNLIVGDNTVTVSVTAQDGVTTKTYTITIRRLAGDATLSSLKVDEKSVHKFDPRSTAYKVNVSHAKTSVTVEGIASDPNATVSVTGGNHLTVGNNTVTVTVTAEDHTITKIYSIVVHRAGAVNIPSEADSVHTQDVSDGTIVTQAGKTLTINGAVIDLPDGAIDSAIQIKVVIVSDTSKLYTNPASKLISDVYEITKSKDDHFKIPVTISIPFDKSLLDPEHSTIGIYWFNEKTKEWVPLDDQKVDHKRGTVSGTVLHFTKFAVLTTQIAKDAHSPTETPTFSDTKEHWASANIQELVQRGVISGYPDNHSSQTTTLREPSLLPL